MSSRQHDNLRSQPKLLLLRVKTCCLALVLWGNLPTEACKFVHAFYAFFTESGEVHCKSKSSRINQINRESRKKHLQCRFWALGRASSQFSGSLRSTTARLNCAASSGSFSWYSCNSNPGMQKQSKTHIFRPPLTQGGSKHLLKEVQGVTENQSKAGN